MSTLLLPGDLGAAPVPAAGFRLTALLEGYRLAARAGGRSPKTIENVAAAVHYFGEFLIGNGFAEALSALTVDNLRRFVIYLQERQCFAHHRVTPPQPKKLSGNTVNSYLRGLQSFARWAEEEGLLLHNPFGRVKVPRAPVVIKRSLSDDEARAVLEAVDTSYPIGVRDLLILLILLDCGPRSAELIGLCRRDISVENRLIKVTGKGNRQREVPYGVKVQRLLWRYTTTARPAPALPNDDHLLLTEDGHPLTKDRLRAIVKKYAIRAGLDPAGICPHAFRRTAVLRMYRGGADLFAIRRVLGHRELSTTQGYVNLDTSDLSRMHDACSPVDTLDFKVRGGRVTVPGRKEKEFLAIPIS